MRLKTKVVIMLILVSMITGSTVAMAGIPAEGYDPADDIYVKAEGNYYWEGRYSDGRIFAEYLAKELAGDFDKVDNYAVGGAFSGVLTGSVEEGTDRSNWSTWLRGWGGVEQTEIFVEKVNGKADPDSLYIINMGGNDSYTIDSLGLDGATEKSAENIVTMIDNLAQAGAKDFIIPLQTTKPGKTETDFSATHREKTKAKIDAYRSENLDLNIVIVDANNLYRNMEEQGKEAYGFKSWDFYLISDWVPAYGYAYAKDDNSNILPTNKAEDIYDYGYYYSTDSKYYNPDAKDYKVDEFLNYDEYHSGSKTHKHLATYILNSDIITEDGVFKKVYNGSPSEFSISPLAEKTYSMVYTFGDSGIDSGMGRKVSAELVGNRKVKSKNILDMVDTQENKWYSTYVNYALQTELMKGIESNVFGLNKPITRAEFITILGRAEEIEDSTADSLAVATFKDVDTSKYFASHIAWAVEKGIINGTGPETFSPNKNISRQEMAKIMGIYAEVKSIELPEASLEFVFNDDLLMGEYAKSYIYEMNEAGILIGYNNKFNPTGDVTREAAAKALTILLNY